MSQIKIYHNPRCSKSRKTLEILQDKGIEPEIIKYLDNAPSIEELTSLLKVLEMQPRELMRKNETDYKDNGFANEKLSNEDLIALMHQFPKVIERPIVISGDKAAIGRPPESVLAIL